MQLSWLEDFLMLLEEKNFSVAAERRYVSQPAFSRRIQALEEWLGVALVDRSKKPVRFMAGIDKVETDIRALTQQIYELRSKLRAERSKVRSVTLGTQQALTVSVFPRLSRIVQSTVGEISFLVRSANWEDCIAMFLRRDVEFLLCYETHQQPARIPSAFACKLDLGTEYLVPVASPLIENRFKRLFETKESLPLLSYPGESFLGRVVMETTLNRIMQNSDVDVVCESAFAAGLKEMALHGMGVAWLPNLLVAGDLEEGRLVDLSESLGTVPIQVSLFHCSATPSETSLTVIQSIENAIEDEEDRLLAAVG